MFPIGSGKSEINPLQVVASEKSKDGESWTVYMTDDKQFTLTKGEYAELRKLTNGMTPVFKFMCQAIEGGN